MTGMENVLAAHAAQGGTGNGNADGGYVFRMCACGERITFYFNTLPEHECNTGKYLDAAFAKHQAEALAAAGFGNLHDAWEEGFSAGRHIARYAQPTAEQWEDLTTNPYQAPKVSET